MRFSNNNCIPKSCLNYRKNVFKASVLFLTIIIVGCVPTKNLTYFNDLDDLKEPGVNPRIQKTIMPFDKLYIRVVSIDESTNQLFNSSEELSSTSGTGGIIGYTIDEAGNLNFPFVGEINVLSLTTSQAGEKIQTALSAYIPNTSVIVKFVENHITIIGEVTSQGVFQFGQDKLNIYEAIGLGGGITHYGDRTKVILIRNEGGKIMHYRLNLSDSKIASKDTYYILANDVIIVEPLKAISTSFSNNTFTTVLSSITTIIAVLFFMGLDIRN